MERKISVVVPTYKPGGYLWECLNSLGSQTLSKDRFEIILVLNGCCEPYKTQINNYLSSNFKGLDITFIQVDESGVSNARNIGLDAIKGEYVVFIDDDDFVSESYLEELLNKATPEIVSLCYPLSFMDGTKTYAKYYISNDYREDQKKIHYNKAKKYFSGPVYKMIHRDIIGDRRFNKKLENGEDSLFMFLISDRMKLISFTSRNAVYYRRIRIGSATKNNRNFIEMLKNTLRLILLYSAIYWRRPFDYNFKFYLTRLMATIHVFFKQI